MLRRWVCLTIAALCAVALAAPSRCEILSFHLQAGQLMGLRVGTQSLPARGVPGGFYVQLYQARTGANLLQDAALDKLPEPLPSGFALDDRVMRQDKPTLTIKMPEDRPVDSGELEFHAQNIKPGRIYLLRFAHRGERLDGEFPPIIHIRQWDARGEWACTQLNMELLCGSYDWKEETIAIPAVEGATSMSFMVHHPAGMGQFWISGLSLEEVIPQPVVAVPGLWRRERGKLTFQGTIPMTDVDLVAAVEEGEERIHITTTLAAPTKRLREKPVAMVLGFRLPLQATGWRWGDYLHRDRVIEAGTDYSDYVLIGREQFREISRFPIAPVAGPEHGIALMAPMTPPLLTRARYDAGGYPCMEWDLGMAPRSKGEVEACGFSFDIADYQPRWGFRAALARYYELYPQLFASAAKQGGWWIGPSQQVKDLTDFGMQYDEDHFAHPDRAKADDQFGIYTCSYSEPWMWRITVSEERKLSLAKPVATYLPQIEKDAELPPDVMDSHDYWPAPRRDSVRAFLNSAIFGPDGDYSINSVRTYGGGTFIEMNTSCLPRLRSDRWGEMNRGLLSYKYETQADIARCAAGGAKLDGVYFDSVGNWPDISAEDHRSEHFQYTSFPLTFSYATGTPVISGLSAMAEYMQFIKAKGSITMANSDPDYISFAAPYLDMIGAGENFGEPFVDDEALSHDRSVAYHKSVSFGNSGMLRAAPEEAEKRFRLLLFYQVYPGIFAGDPAALERVRPLYRKYIPLMREMGAAGWEPIPWATPDDAAILVERYGPAAEGTTYFALRNPTDTAVACALGVEPAGFGRKPTAAQKAVNVLTGDEIPIRRVGDGLRLTVEVPAQDTAVVKVEFRG